MADSSLTVIWPPAFHVHLGTERDWCSLRFERKEAAAMPSRRGARLGSTCKVVVVTFLMLVVPSKALAGCSVPTRHSYGRRESFTRCPNSEGAARVAARDDGQQLHSDSNSNSADPSRSGEVDLEDMELWLDETGVDRRGDGEGIPSAKLRRFSGRGIGLEAAVDLERDSTVRHNMTPLVRWSAGLPVLDVFSLYPPNHVRHVHLCLLFAYDS